MSLRLAKRKIEDKATDKDESGGKLPRSNEEASGSSRSSRARKKSAKLLEMEEFESELSSSMSKNARSRKKSRSQEDENVTSPSQKSPKKQNSARSPVSDVPIVSTSITKKDGGDPLKLILSLPPKSEPPQISPGELPVSTTEETSPPVKAKRAKAKSSARKSKKQTEEVQESSDITSPDEMPTQEKIELLPDDPDIPDDEPKLVVAEKPKKKRPPKKKNVKIVEEEQPIGTQPALLNYEADPKVEMMDYEAFVQTMEANQNEEELVEMDDKDDVDDDMAESDTSPKPTKKKKATNSGGKGKMLKGKGKKKEENEEKAAKTKTPQRRTTAYTLWCNNTRKQLMLQYPTLDFAQISKKLAELWHTVSIAEKNNLRKQARKIQKKQNDGKDIDLNPAPLSTHIRSGQVKNISRVIPQIQNTEVQYTPPVAASYNFKVTGNAPLDVAAHLKLLGESLGTIGARLQEHRGQIAVQGSLSVLLDSLLCAMGPLMCLTNQVPELNSVPTQVHIKTLDNIAYIMPGIG